MEDNRNLIATEAQTTGMTNMAEEEESSFNFRAILSILILNWQWFVLSFIIAMACAMLYLRYKTPIYQVSTKMLIKDEQTQRSRSNQMLSNMQDLGFMTNSAGIDNEVEILQSNILSRQAVKDLKLYVTYMSDGVIKDRLIYGTQPVSIDIDPTTLAEIDKNVLLGYKYYKMRLSKNGTEYRLEGKVYDTEVKGGKPIYTFGSTIKHLPTAIQTKYGTFTLTQNVGNEWDKRGRDILISIVPPYITAIGYSKSMTVEPTSKLTTIAQLTIHDQSPLRAIDFLNQLALVYNQQANADKNEIAMKTEEFINERLQKIDAELGTTEGALENYKKRNRLTELKLDATQTLTQNNEYTNRLAEANTQIQLLDYLREYVDNPDNRYQLIPGNVGLTDQASTQLIVQYNQNVQNRERLLRSASEDAPQVKTLTATLDQLQRSIRTALLQARRSADIHRQGIQSQYSIYQQRVANAPEQERILTQIGRQQEVKSGLYLMLLQKREENSISLAATANKGQLIDEPQYEGQTAPKRMMVMLIAMVLGLGLPLAIIYLLQLLRYKIEGREDVLRLTRLPLVADIPVANEKAKTAVGGIVVRENENNQMDEIFRSLRANVQFMMKENEKVVQFTSSTSGEGKTFIAANLATSFAILGKRTILVGLDIRKPALGRLFQKHDRQQGITNLLRKDKLTADDIHSQIDSSDTNPNLDLLLAGPTPPNPTELLARPNLHNIIEMLRQEYDIVILDTAPVGLVTDTLEIARWADVTCFVCRADFTPKSSFAQVNQLADEKKVPNPCIILNGVDMSKKKYGYYYGYGRYGKYGRYGSYGRYGAYGAYGNYGNYGNYADSHYGNKNDDSIKK